MNRPHACRNFVAIASELDNEGHRGLADFFDPRMRGEDRPCSHRKKKVGLCFANWCCMVGGCEPFVPAKRRKANKVLHYIVGQTDQVWIEDDARWIGIAESYHHLLCMAVHSVQESAKRCAWERRSRRRGLDGPLVAADFPNPWIRRFPNR